MPTGAMVAALTTSLPETPGGERNWDYRYTWMRDATFTLQGLHALGLSWEADDFIQFVADVERNEDGGLQIMYGIGGEKRLEEQTLDHLTGYEGARPVRVGNGAYDQRQNDVYGAVLDSIYLHQKEYGHNSPRLWPVIEDQARCAAAVWRGPTRASGRRAASPTTTSAARSCAGSRSTAPPASPPGAATRASPTSGAWSPTRSTPTCSTTASTRAASSPSTTTPTRSTPRTC